METTFRKFRVFLGGTCVGEDWREEFISFLHPDTVYFNPVVKNWNKAAKARENTEKELCDINLFYINSSMVGAYSIAEAVDSANQRGSSCVFAVNVKGFSDEQINSFEAIIELIRKRGGSACFVDNIKELVEHVYCVATERKRNNAVAISRTAIRGDGVVQNDR